MTFPEWAVVLILTGIGVVMWWGVRRLVATNDHTNATLVEIGHGLASMNNRLGRAEVWQDMHQRSDDRQFDDMRARFDAMTP
jgi:hypothetical protein